MLCHFRFNLNTGLHCMSYFVNFAILVGPAASVFSCFRPGVTNSNCSVGQMRIYKVIIGPHYDADTIKAVPQTY